MACWRLEVITGNIFALTGVARELLASSTASSFVPARPREPDPISWTVSLRCLSCDCCLVLTSIRREMALVGPVGARGKHEVFSKGLGKARALHPRFPQARQRPQGGGPGARPRIRKKSRAREIPPTHERNDRPGCPRNDCQAPADTQVPPDRGNRLVPHDALSAVTHTVTSASCSNSAGETYPSVE